MPKRKKEHELMLSKQCKLHLEQEGMTGFQHMRRALRIAVKLQLAIPALLVHSVVSVYENSEQSYERLFRRNKWLRNLQQSSTQKCTADIQLQKSNLKVWSLLQTLGEAPCLEVKSNLKEKVLEILDLFVCSLLSLYAMPQDYKYAPSKRVRKTYNEFRKL